MKAFIDTNILIDLACQRKDFFEEAKELFLLGYTNKITIAFSTLSFVNAVYISKKYGYTLESTKSVLSNIASFTEILDLPNGKNIIDALLSDWKNFEDCVQTNAAIEGGCDCIITRNKKDFVQSEIPVYTIKEFLDTTGL